MYIVPFDTSLVQEAQAAARAGAVMPVAAYNALLASVISERDALLDANARAGRSPRVGVPAGVSDASSAPIVGYADPPLFGRSADELSIAQQRDLERADAITMLARTLARTSSLLPLPSVRAYAVAPRGQIGAVALTGDAESLAWEADALPAGFGVRVEPEAFAAIERLNSAGAGWSTSLSQQYRASRKPAEALAVLATFVVVGGFLLWRQRTTTLEVRGPYARQTDISEL
jgi:hypothetical protein